MIYLISFYTSYGKVTETIVDTSEFKTSLNLYLTLTMKINVSYLIFFNILCSLLFQLL